jgi:fatty acid desaturase
VTVPPERQERELAHLQRVEGIVQHWRRRRIIATIVIGALVATGLGSLALCFHIEDWYHALALLWLAALLGYGGPLVTLYVLWVLENR